MKCQYCNEYKASILVKFDKNCEPAMMCKECAKEFKPIEEIIEEI
jgi:protein-arginine kinase activator protein McsA